MTDQINQAGVVVATLPDLESARAALMALERSGIDGERISIVGRPAELAAALAAHDTSAADTGVLGDVAKATVAGGAAGTVAGGLAGFLAGAAAFAIPGVGPVIGTGVWVATAGGATLGSILGVITGVASIPNSEDWELTYQTALSEGRALVAVHPKDADEADRAVETLRRLDPVMLDRYDAAER